MRDSDPRARTVPDIASSGATTLLRDNTLPEPEPAPEPAQEHMNPAYLDNNYWALPASTEDI